MRSLTTLAVWRPALVVGAVYPALLAVFVLRHHHSALSLAHLGTVVPSTSPGSGSASAP